MDKIEARIITNPAHLEIKRRPAQILGFDPRSAHVQGPAEEVETEAGYLSAPAAQLFIVFG